jgi:uncharacterized membrane protein YphA (DoxX/SURF4 family)
MQRYAGSFTASLLLAVAVVAMLVEPLWAHVKWFVHAGAHAAQVHPYSFAEPAVQVWVAVTFVCLVLALWLDHRIPELPTTISSMTSRHRAHIVEFFQVMVGVALLVTAVKGAILAPHLGRSSSIGLLMRMLEAAIGVLLLTNVAVRLAAVSMIVLFIACAGVFGFISSLEYFNFLGTALFLFINAHARRHPETRLRPYAIPLLRIHVGVAIGVLAWTEKLLDPTPATLVLKEYQLNFMKALGVGAFDDRLFILSAGCTELIFAIVFVLGIVTRLNTATFAGFMISSNLYFLTNGKIHEAVLEFTGHLPLLAVALMLMIYGSGCWRVTTLVWRRSDAALLGGFRTIMRDRARAARQTDDGDCRGRVAARP